MITPEKELTQFRTRPAFKMLAGIAGIMASASACKGATVYYEPNNTLSHDVPAQEVMVRSEWAVGSCRSDLADTFQTSHGNLPVDTLAGWSLGRLGIAYFLDEASKETTDKYKNIDHLVYFDPANYEDFTTNICDQRSPSQSARLAAWLSSDPNNRVTVLAGAYTVDAGNPNAFGQTSAGVREMLFADIAGTALSSQVKVCEDADVSHSQALTLYSSLMSQEYSDSCPAGTIMWRP